MSERQKAVDFAIKLNSYISMMFGDQIRENLEPIILNHFEEMYEEAMVNDCKFHTLQARLEKAEELNRVYESALSFYSSKEHYVTGKFQRGPNVFKDTGQQARLALAAKTQKE